MSDYNFLKTGFSNLVEPIKLCDKNREDIEIMLGLFTSNALINASKYTQYCERNSVTKIDILYGLQYEIFEFLQRNNLNEGLEEIRKDYEKLNLEEYEVDEDYDEDNDEIEEYEDKDEIETIDYNDVIEEYEDKNEIEKIEENYDILENDNFEFDLNNTELKDLSILDIQTQPFCRIEENKINDENIEFIEKMHNYHDSWEMWKPQSDLEMILKTAIDRIN